MTALGAITKCEQDAAIRDACLDVAAKFPGLSTAGFFAEVWWRFYPRIDDNDIKAIALRMVNMGELVYTSDWRVCLP